MAMILGMLPSAMGRGEGGEFRSPISIATIGGLITSTALTLVVVPVAYLLLARLLARVKAWRSQPAAGLHPAARIAGIVLVLALVGWLLSTTSAFAQTGGLSQPPSGALSLTFDQALERALNANQGLKVVQEQVRESQARVSEAKTAYLPQVNFNYLYTPSQKFPVIRIPPGIFGPDETTFQANFTRENVLGLDITQPLYTGGRLNNSQAIQESGLDAHAPHARPLAPGPFVPRGRSVLQRPAAAAGCGRRRGADSPVRDAAAARERPLRGRHGRPPRRAAGPGAARQRARRAASSCAPRWTPRSRPCAPSCRCRRTRC